MKYLTAEEILRLHFYYYQRLCRSHGVRDHDRLYSVVDAPKQPVFGVKQYVGVLQKAAVYIRNKIGDYPFADGNKRTGITVSAVFLMRNGWNISADTKHLEDFAVEVAVKNLDVEVIAAWLETHTIKM